MSATTYVYDATILDIHDGDTVKVAARLTKSRAKSGSYGFHVYIEDGFLTYHTNLRLLGLNAPELSTPEGKVSRTYLLTLISVGDIISIQSSVAAHEIDPDKYGDRWDAVLIRKRDNLNINDEMVKTGHALPWTGQGPKPV